MELSNESAPWADMFIINEIFVPHGNRLCFLQLGHYRVWHAVDENMLTILVLHI